MFGQLHRAGGAATCGGRQCWNQYGGELERASHFAATGVKCCWNPLFDLLQSNLLEFAVCGILLEPEYFFAGTTFLFCYNRICWSFAICGILLEPVFFLAGTSHFFASTNHHSFFVLLEAGGAR